MSVWWGDLLRGATTTGGPQYLRNRYCDANTGRFTQEDPIGLAGGLNLYGFAGGDPVNFSDPFGLCPNALATGMGSLQCVLQDAFSAFSGSTAGMFAQWATGTGPASRTFGSGSSQVSDMQGARGVNEARAFFLEKNAGNIAAGGALVGVNNFAGRFGVGGIIAAGGNGTQQFVGSFGVAISPGNDGTMTFTLTNTTSLKSFLYGIGPAYERSTFGPGGNMRQTFTWKERIPEK